jgi:hypothetical protein
MRRIILLLVFMIMVVGLLANSAVADCTATPIRGLDLCAPPAFKPEISGFIPFDFVTHFTQSPGVVCDPTMDIRLDAVTYNNKTRTDIMLVSSAHVVRDIYFGPPGQCVVGTGHGPNTDADPLLPPTPFVLCSDPNIETALAGAHGNLDLTSINYNREVPSGVPPRVYPNCDLNGDAIFTISFPAPTDRFLIYERGMDSDIHIEALNSNGQPIAYAEIPRYDLDLGDPKLVKYAGFNITTTLEPGRNVGPQPVGSVGLQLEKGMLSDTLRITVIPKTDFGADLKILALAPEHPDKKLSLIPCPINYPAGGNVAPGGGFVIFNNPNGAEKNLIVNGALKKVEPNTEYDLYLFVDDEPMKLGTVKTNPQGNATFNLQTLLSAGVHYLGFDVTKKGSQNDVYETPGIHEKKGTVLAFNVK